MNGTVPAAITSTVLTHDHRDARASRNAATT
jgi:hypothetical protein